MLSARPFGLSAADLLGIASVVIAFWFAVPQLTRLRAHRQRRRPEPGEPGQLDREPGRVDGVRRRALQRLGGRQLAGRAARDRRHPGGRASRGGAAAAAGAAAACGPGLLGRHRRRGPAGRHARRWTWCSAARSCGSSRRLRSPPGARRTCPGSPGRPGRCSPWRAGVRVYGMAADVGADRVYGVAALVGAGIVLAPAAGRRPRRGRAAAATPGRAPA